MWGRADAAVAPPDSPAQTKPVKTRAGARKQPLRVEPRVQQAPVQLRGRVDALQAVGDTWFAAATQGVFHSTDGGVSWTPIVIPESANSPNRSGSYRTIAAHDRQIFIGRREGILVSNDAGAAWHAVPLPAGLTALSSLALTPDGTLWAGGREGVFFSKDQGQAWSLLKRLPVVAVNSLAWDSSLLRLMVTCDVGTVIYAVDPRDDSWTWWNAGWTVHAVASLGKRLAAASFYSGVVMQPEIEISAKTGDAVQDARR
jgi:photosystem II stability/assembly factor-like uncharacterized protein